MRQGVFAFSQFSVFTTNGAGHLKENWSIPEFSIAPAPRHFTAQGFFLSALPAQLDFLRKSLSTLNNNLIAYMRA